MRWLRFMVSPLTHTYRCSVPRVPLKSAEQTSSVALTIATVPAQLSVLNLAAMLGGHWVILLNVTEESMTAEAQSATVGGD
jgi:hypothetical protein